MNGRVFVEMTNGMTVVFPLQHAGGCTEIVPFDDGSLRIELALAASRSVEENILLGYFNPGTWNCAHISLEGNQ